MNSTFEAMGSVFRPPSINRGQLTNEWVDRGRRFVTGEHSMSTLKNIGSMGIFRPQGAHSPPFYQKSLNRVVDNKNTFTN